MLTFEAYACLLRPVILAMQEECGEPPFMLARRLNRRGVPTLDRKRWTAAQVVAVLQRSQRPGAMARGWPPER